MIRRLLLAAATALLFTSLAAPAAFAQEEDGDVTVIYKKKTVIDFEDVLLQGELRKPQGAFLQDRRRTKFDSLITLRESFEREMFRSLDELK